MALLTINGRKQFFNCNTIELKSVSNGRWQVTYAVGNLSVMDASIAR